MYLIDTNIWLERMLDQDESAIVGEFLTRLPTDRFLVTDFTPHSIGVILHRLKRPSVLLQFIDDVFIQGGARLVSVRPAEMHQVIAAIERFNLDFDDAYQYVAAQLFDAIIVSFDRDFDRSDAGRQTPQEILSATSPSG